VEPNSASNSGAIQLLLAAAFFIPAILFLLTQQNTLKLIRPENRRIAPGLVWLQLVPLFGQVWQFFVISKISRSIRSELESPRGDSILGLEDVFVAGATRKQPTRGIGITYSALYWIMFLGYVGMAGARLGESNNRLLVIGLFGWATIICWIVYWANLAWYKRKLKVLVAVI
jgi:hypothetical protein